MNLDFFENKYFFAIFAIFSTMYAFQIRPNLPDFLVKLFQNSFFRVAILFLVLYRGYKDVQFSILVAGAFVIIMDAVRQKAFKETFSTEVIIDGETNETLETYADQNTTDDCDINQRTLNEAALCETLWFNKGGRESKTFKNISKAYANLVPKVQQCLDADPRSRDPYMLPPGSNGLFTTAEFCEKKYGQ
jgi:hypothetical protein